MGMLAIGGSVTASSAHPLVGWYRQTSGLKQIIALSAALVLAGITTFGAMVVAFRDFDVILLAPLGVVALVGFYGFTVSPYLAYSAFSLIFSTLTVLFATPLLLFGLDGVGVIVFSIPFLVMIGATVASAEDIHGVHRFKTVLVQLGMVVVWNAAVWGTLFAITR